MQDVRKKATIIGVLMDLGADRRGVDMGPSAVRVADLNERLGALGYEVTDAGNIPVRNPEMLPITDRSAKYLPEIAEACQKLAVQVEAALESGSIPIVLGGDHSIAIGRRRRAVGVPSQTQPQSRRHLVRRPRRYEHAGKLAFGQYPRHALRGDSGARRKRADSYQRLCAESFSRRLRTDRRAQR